MAFSARPSRAFLFSLAALLALFHAVLAVTATAGKSVTADEIGHLTGGHVYNKRGDFRLQPENGNLPQRLAALPLLAAGAEPPPASSRFWSSGDVWNYGHVFFYEQGLSTDEFLFLGRAMIALVSAGTALLVFFWSRALFGWAGGFLSLLLYVFSPTLLAHGALATSDLVMTFFFLVSVGAWWRHLETPSWSWTALSALTLGLAFVAKFSAVLLPPMLALIAAAWLAGRVRSDGWRSPLLRLLRSTAVHGIVAWVVIWAFYGFRFSAFAPGFDAGAGFNRDWDWLLAGLEGPARIVLPLRKYHLLPEAWLYGFTFVVQFSHARGAFLNGEYSLTGWPIFFPFTFLVKSTPPFLLLTAALATRGAATLAVRLRRDAAAAFAWLRPVTPLAVLFAVYWATSLASHLNIGHRHILPTYPVLFIACGWFGRWLAERRPFAALLILALLAWHIGVSFAIRPDYLAYFNPISGGPQNGWRHLVDSSLDWGQDLPATARWLEESVRRPTEEPVFISYFGTGEPDYEGIVANRLPCIPTFGRPHPWRPLTAGIYCVSATMLQQVYSDLHEWTPALEREYQQLRVMESTLLDYDAHPEHRAKRLQELPAERWQQLWKRYDQLRFARLCPYLRLRGPDANAGYSILIFRLSAEEVADVTGSLTAWQARIERTAASH